MKEITYNDIDRLIKLRKGEVGHPDTCADYPDSFNQDINGKYITWFVEPVGDIESPRFSTYGKALRWWEKVFKTQPKDLNYIDAGWHLFNLSRNGELPIDATFVWKNIVIKEMY